MHMRKMSYRGMPRAMRVFVLGVAIGLLLALPGGSRLKARAMAASETPETIILKNAYSEIWVTPALGGAVNRWIHTPSGVELIRGYQSKPLKGGSIGCWQETLIDPQWQASPEKPVATSYAVMEQGDETLTLEAALPNGLVLTRTMRLFPDRSGVELDLTLHNPTDSPIAFAMKIRPEFWNQNRHEPAIWLDRGDTWERLKTWQYCGNLSFGSVDPKGVERWTLEVPGTGLVIVNTFSSAQLDSLYYWCRRPTQQANLELIPKKTPFAPGETRTVQVTYGVFKGLPPAHE